MKYTYINNGGDHQLPDGTNVLPGKTFISDCPNLCALFPNKFTLVETPQTGDDGTANPDPAPAPPQAPNPAPAAPTAPQPGDADRGDNVTSEFDGAADAGLTVFKRERGWYVYDFDGTEPVNDKPLRKKDVPGFIQNYLED